MNTQQLTTDLESTKVRSMREVAREARDKEQDARALGNHAEAELYRDIAARAQVVADREAKLRYSSEIVPQVRAQRERDAVERSARIEWWTAWGGIALAVIALAALATGCNQLSDRPRDMPASIEDAAAAPLVVTARYDAPYAEPFWADWRGRATLELGLPQAGEGLAAEASLIEGFDGLEGCLSQGLDEGTWSLDETTGVFASTLVSDTGTVVELAGRLMMRSTGKTATDATYLIGNGTWLVTPGPGCDPAAFAGGLSGSWSCEQADTMPAVEDEPQTDQLRGQVLRHHDLKDGSTLLIVRGRR